MVLDDLPDMLVLDKNPRKSIRSRGIYRSVSSAFLNSACVVSLRIPQSQFLGKLDDSGESLVQLPEQQDRGAVQLGALSCDWPEPVLNFGRALFCTGGCPECSQANRLSSN